MTEDNPYRIELWGDEIDSIRYYDTMSQRSNEKTEEITIYPAYEFVLDKKLDEVIEDVKEKDFEQAIRVLYNSFVKENVV